MAKENGLGMTCTVDDSTGSGQAISNDITDLKWEMPSDVQEVTGINKSAKERLLLVADFSITLNGVFNDASNMSFAVFKNYRTLAASQTGRTTSIAISGQTLANEVLYNDFSFSRSDSGEFTWTAPGDLSDGTVPAWS